MLGLNAQGRSARRQDRVACRDWARRFSEPENPEGSAPAGWTAAEFYLLTWGERKLIASSLENYRKWTGRKNQTFAIRDLSHSESLRITGQTQRFDDTEQNALQHAIWNKEMVRAWGLGDAKAWADAHEDLGRALSAKEAKQRDMDFHNNAIGRQFANSSGFNGSGTADVLNGRSGLCWISGPGASSYCSP